MPSGDLSDSITYLDHTNPPPPNFERHSLLQVSPSGFHYRPPQPPHLLHSSELTPETTLFQTIHMGTPQISLSSYLLLITGLVTHPFTLTFAQLLSLPSTSITAFHECYGSPLKPPTTNPLRIGNVRWTGVRLSHLLGLAGVKRGATHVWSDGLEHGTFADVTEDRYRKDVTMEKAMSGDVLVAYMMNDEMLERERGGPVRLVVPGWYGTNSTKWVCRIEVADRRAEGAFTTRFYNELDPRDESGTTMRPVWSVEVNSFLGMVPTSEGSLKGPEVRFEGRAWGAEEVQRVSIWVMDSGHDNMWREAAVVAARSRREHEWQSFEAVLVLNPGHYKAYARATDLTGVTQPISGRRNHVNIIEITVT